MVTAVRRIPVIVFIIGVIILIAGIVIGFSAPSTATWEPQSRILATEKPLDVTAGWVSKSKSPMIDQVITVYSYETYDFWFAYKPFILDDAKDFQVSGNATEQSSSQRSFNFYVFDSVNFDLWKAQAPSTSYYVTQGKTSTTFTFSIATEEAVPSTFYFVVQENATDIKPIVRVTATISWAEKASLYECSDYFSSWELGLTFEQSKDFALIGSANETANRKFNFYIFNSENYFKWLGEEAYTAYHEEKEVTTSSFDVPLTKDEATSLFYFVAENPLLNNNETVQFSATLEWNEKATIATTIGGWILGGAVAFVGFITIIIAGVAALVFKPKASEVAPTRSPDKPAQNQSRARYD